MSTDPAKLEQLQGLLSAVNNSLTKQDFVTAFKSVYTFVKKIKEDNDTELQGIKTQFSVLASSLKGNNSQEIKDLKNSVNTILKDSIAEMWVEQDAKLQILDKKISLIRDGVDGIDGMDGKDGKDADENAIVQRVITMVPLDTPKQLVEKLETLKGDERLDASAIKNLPEFNGRMGGGLSRATADALYAPIGSGSGSGVDTANSPNANEFARFTDSDTIEGLTPAETRTALGLVIGTNVQAYDADLTTWAGLTPSANAQSLVTAADYAAMKALLDLEIGTDVQAYSANLDEYAAVNPTVAGLALLDDATTAAQLVTLGFTATITELNYTDGVTSAIQAQLDGKAASLGADDNYVTDAEKVKLGHITITQAVDLDTIEARVNSLDAAVVLRGSWDASAGTFPGGGTAQAGDSYIVSVGGTVNSIVFTANDRIVAITDNASTATYAANWLKLDYTDQVQSVAGRTGVVTLATADITDITASAAELNVLDGITSTVTELNYTDGVTSAIQAQLDGKQPLDSDLTTIAGLTATTDNFIVSVSSAWASRTPAQVKTTLSLNNVDNTSDATKNAAAVTLANKTIASPSLTGVGLLAEGASIGLDPALSADGTWSGNTITGTAGYTQAFGDLVYLDPTDSRWEMVDANAASGADGDARGIVCMVVVAGTDGNACTLLLPGSVIRADAKFPTFTVNAPIYASETAGAVTNTQPTTTDVVIRVVGFGLDGNSMFFNPSPTYITHT